MPEEISTENQKPSNSSVFDGWESKRVPEPVSEYDKPDWRNPPVLTFGHKLLDELDPERTVLPEDMQKKVLCLQTEEALVDFLHFNLGENSMAPDIQTASKVFGRLAETPILIPNMLGAWRVYSIAQCLSIVHESQTLAKEKGMSRADRIVAQKSAIEALKALAVLIERAQKYFNKLKLLELNKRDRSKKKVVVKPVRSAPNFG